MSTKDNLRERFRYIMSDCRGEDVCHIVDGDGQHAVFDVPDDIAADVVMGLNMVEALKKTHEKMVRQRTIRELKQKSRGKKK